MTEDEKKYPTIREKMNQVRLDSTGLDWSPAGVLSFGGSKGGTPYISLSQMKANLAPLFARNRLEFTPRMDRPEPVGSPSAPSGWVVHLHTSIEDVDSDDTIESDFYGYGTGDKGMSIATSYALKNMLTTTFLIADGMDPVAEDFGDIDRTPFTPKSPSEKVAAVAKVKDAAARTAPKAPAAPAKPAEAPKTVENTDKTAETPSGVASISETRRAAVVKLLEDISKGHQDGTVTDAEWDEVSSAAEKLDGNTAANMFIIKYRKLVR